MLYVVELVLGASWKELPIYFVTLGNYDKMRGFAKLEYASQKIISKAETRIAGSPELFFHSQSPIF